MRRALWIVAAVVIVAASIAALWVLRPTWAFCVDGVDPQHSNCGEGVFSGVARIGTVALAVLLIGYLVAVIKGPRMLRIVGLIVLLLAAGLALGLQQSNLEPIPPFAPGAV